MVTLAQEAARRAGSILLEHFGRSSLSVEEKAPNDYVSDADRRAEEAIRKLFAEEAPDHALLMEESGSHGQSDWEWVVDPLDGTTNYIHRYPFFCVSLALRHRGRTVLGVVYDPLRAEMFTAEDGEPTRLNGVPVPTTRRREVSRSLVSTGFPFRLRHHLEAYLRAFHRVQLAVGDQRRDGSAALDLAYVATGRCDAYWELGLKPWDTAAGALLVRAAGGVVSDFHGGEAYDDGGDIVAGDDLTHAAILAVTREIFAARPIPL